MDDNEEAFTYMIAIENTDNLKNTDLRQISIPKSTWAVFQCKGPLPDAMQSVWKRIYSEWFPSTGYEHAGTPELEVYLPGSPDDENYISEIWIPIKDKV
jgi:AraC family transcriptional regulator